MTSETRLAAAFVELAEALVTDVELGEFLHLLSCRAIELLEVDAAGVMLADENDRLRAIAASNEDTHNLEVFVAASGGRVPGRLPLGQAGADVDCRNN